MRHADGLRSLSLARIDGKDSPSHRLRHIGARIDGNDEIGGKHRRHVNVEKHGGSIVNKHGLNHHGRSAEYLHIHIQYQLNKTQDHLFYRVVRLTYRNRLDNSDCEANQAADKGANNGNHHGLSCTV